MKEDSFGSNYVNSFKANTILSLLLFDSPYTAKKPAGESTKVSSLDAKIGEEDITEFPSAS